MASPFRMKSSKEGGRVDGKKGGKRGRGRLFICFSVLGAVTAALVSFLPAYFLLFVSRVFPYSHTPADFGVASWRNVTIFVDHRYAGTVALSAWYWRGKENVEKGGVEGQDGSSRLPSPQRGPPPSPRACALVVHGHAQNMGRLQGDGTLSVLQKAALPLSEAGFDILMIDLRNHGTSTVVGVVSFGLDEAEDVGAAVEWLASEGGCGRVGIWAESMGAAASVFALAETWQKRPLPPNLVRALAMDSPFATARLAFDGHLSLKIGVRPPEWLLSWMWWCAGKIALLFEIHVERISPLDAIAHIDLPILHTHGIRDHLISFEQALSLERKIRGVRSQKCSAEKEEEKGTERRGDPAKDDRQDDDIGTSGEFSCGPEYLSLWYNDRHVRSYTDSRYYSVLIPFFLRHVGFGQEGNSSESQVQSGQAT
uniref:Serine aminopeptidase S33 domain-containing protein n=1 Tax=Chromera velia CCMP2878 TaxID=1169474 RepID=A0A0G4HY92_9ALVE|mmetsp:Transcript_50608/g.99556  ORF Transcript_50608/g.99556 Transcript_50608/m.99556 type:complete len:425 (-) Transcript_50608:167-1441(-)|eukprot:Cvel_9433.t1-p1 / transcript=Cvel_9433.t1 / gene=Cvel_9433 / organism=Chromera_velia_CCMP2878 / gene_product=hypothetical protein / transcript_product=hypothetical protein / location=Cvel_scaffold544:13942-19364(-) / protein_length=424 / sequence_SO=supercontig / SO=protein_coding / is_pseudo=false